MVRQARPFSARANHRQSTRWEDKENVLPRLRCAAWTPTDKHISEDSTLARLDALLVSSQATIRQDVDCLPHRTAGVSQPARTLEASPESQSNPVGKNAQLATALCASPVPSPPSQIAAYPTPPSHQRSPLFRRRYDHVFGRDSGAKSSNKCSSVVDNGEQIPAAALQSESDPVDTTLTSTKKAERDLEAELMEASTAAPSECSSRASSRRGSSCPNAGALLLNFQPYIQRDCSSAFSSGLSMSSRSTSSSSRGGSLNSSQALGFSKMQGKPRFTTRALEKWWNLIDKQQHGSVSTREFAAALKEHEELLSLCFIMTGADCNQWRSAYSDCSQIASAPQADCDSDSPPAHTTPRFPERAQTPGGRRHDGIRKVREAVREFNFREGKMDFELFVQSFQRHGMHVE